MTTTAAPAAPATTGGHFHWMRWLVFALVVVVIGAVATLCGWDIKGWFSDLWDTMTSISLAALLGALTLKTVPRLPTTRSSASRTRVACVGWRSSLPTRPRSG